MGSPATARPTLAQGAWAPALAGLFALVALASIAQGILEFLLPLARGDEPFALTRALADRLGSAALFGAILFHNVGLALVLPGCGILAARAEREDAKRRWIAPILLVATVGAVAVGFLTVLRIAPRSDVAFTLALAAGEALAVMSVGLATAREMRRFRMRVPDPQGMALALRSLRPALALSVGGLAVLALIETMHLVGAA